MKDPKDITKMYISDTNSDKDITKLFKNLQGEKTELIRKSVENIQELIQQRKELNKEIFANIDKIKVDIGNFTSEMPSLIGRGDEASNAEVVKIKGKMKEVLINLDQKKVEEKLNCWRDIAQLQEELREHLKELREKESKNQLLDTLLE